MYTTGSSRYNNNHITRSKPAFRFYLLTWTSAGMLLPKNQSLQLLVKKLQYSIGPPCSSIDGNTSKQPLNRNLLPHGRRLSIVVTCAFERFKRRDPWHFIYVNSHLWYKFSFIREYSIPLYSSIYSHNTSRKLLKCYPIPQLLLHSPFSTSYRFPHHFLP